MINVVSLLFCSTEQAIRFTWKNKTKKMEFMREENLGQMRQFFFKKKKTMYRTQTYAYAKGTNK